MGLAQPVMLSERTMYERTREYLEEVSPILNISLSRYFSKEATEINVPEDIEGMNDCLNEMGLGGFTLLEHAIAYVEERELLGSDLPKHEIAEAFEFLASIKRTPRNHLSVIESLARILVEEDESSESAEIS